MVRKIYMLLVLAVLSHEIAAVHNGTVLPIYRVQDAALLKVRKQLLTHSKRAQTFMPMATIAGAGILGYFFFDGREKVKKKEEIETDRKTVINSEILSERQKNILVPLVLRELAVKQKEKEWEQLPWYTRVWKNMWNQISNNIGYVMGAVVIYKIQSKAGKLLKAAESYLPPLIDRAINNLHPDPSFDWYKSSRTKYERSLRDLSRYVSLYVAPEEMRDIKNKLKELDAILSAELPDVEPENREQEQTIMQTKMQLGMLQEQKIQLEAKLAELEAANRHEIDELELCRRISAEATYFMQEIEKLIGFLAFADNKIVYSDIDAREKLQLRISNGHIMRSLKSFADSLARTIEPEIMQGRNKKTLLFSKEVGDILSQIQEELESFSKIEHRIYQVKPIK